MKLLDLLDRLQGIIHDWEAEATCDALDREDVSALVFLLVEFHRAEVANCLRDERQACVEAVRARKGADGWDSALESAIKAIEQRNRP